MQILKLEHYSFLNLEAYLYLHSSLLIIFFNWKNNKVFEK